ncbi:cilia- and flagella-associated protein 91 [Xyrichtys novacula]|uniref:Cilia- and flagella-associated protein 91 n=1 Tax=Xyrichtys novacula TaxID=13765 RepID=A0AAV1H4A4_XYRNO|nr:cilia- and flagella-associated protein 91 [Xyrichtys novacula]
MSLSETRTVPRKHKANKVVQRQRAYDHLYDPVYTVSSEVDHARANLRAHASKDRIRQVPVFESMFSTLPHHPSYTLQLDASDPVPPTIERRWQGHAEQRKAALQQLAGVIPNDKLRLQREDCHVTGADRWKFFKRPLIPYLQQAPSNIIFTLPTDDFEPICGRKAEQGPTHFTVGVQTDYRESETQTDPYSPDYVVQPGTTPSELLQMATLLWGRGLPAGQAEVEMIQRARARLAWEATLPPMDDLSQLDKRRRMMEEMDAKEWAFREGEIKKLQEARLAVLKDLVKQRDENQNKVTSERIDQIHSRLLKNKDTRLNKINNDYLRSLHKLETRRRNLRERQEGCVTSKRSSSSQMNAFHTSRDTSKKEFKSHYLDTYEGLQKLEAGLAASTLKPQVIKPKPREKLRKDVVKPPVSREEQLMLKYKALKEEEEQAQKPLRVLVKKEKPVPRPPTPKVEEPPEGDENTELGVIQLQKLLRGRSVQYQMFSGKENHLNLIQELRTVHALQAEEQRLQKADKEMLLTQKKQRDQLRKKRSQELAFQASAVGAELEHLFSTLSKDLIHLQEERRIHAFTLMAERDRRLREAEESGRRQVEERRRREEDEIFRQVVEVHQETLDLYLEDIILQTLEQTADQQARGEIHRKAKEVNDIAYAMEESGINSLQSEEIVSELVHSFLIPEIEKINVRQRVHQRQLRHLKAARSIIQGTAEHSGFLPSIQGASAVTCLSEKAANQVFEETIHQEEQEQRKDGK